MKVTAQITVVVFLFGLAIMAGVYKFNDCRKVGHSVFYCIMDMG